MTMCKGVPTDPVRLTALLHGPDQLGIVARAATWIFNHGGNIVHADQHRDSTFGIFFQRIEWIPQREDWQKELEEFKSYGESLGMEVKMASSAIKPKMGILVSKIPHCFHDLILRWKSGELHCEIPLIISNHQDLEEAAHQYGIPFHYIPVTKSTKQSAEDQQLALFKEAEVELIVMARYMQVLSGRFLKEVGVPVINIHHSFLPAFAGAKPYHQAYKRGVKLIGATAHYATENLDEGPIIQQAVDSVNHRHSIQDLIRKGRDLEKTVFARAVRFHLDHRVLAYANKTVVFD